MRKSAQKMMLLSLLVLVVLQACPQDQRGKDEPWRDLESELRHQGIKTDTSSLIELVRSNRDVGLRWMAIEVLGLRGNQEARGALQEVLRNDPSRLLQESAGLALARLKDESGIPALRNLMGTASNPERQVFLASRLAEFGDPGGYAFVVKALGSQDEHLKYLAAGALVSFVPFEVKGRHEIDAVERLIELASDKSPLVRKEALIQFSLAIGKGASLDRLRVIAHKMATDDSDPDVREAAQGFLALWNSK